MNIKLLSIQNVFAIMFVFILGGFAYFANPSFLKTQKVEAGTAQNVSGYAWSSNIGWISFNNTNDGSATSYGVNIDTANQATGGIGLFSGYAWSSNVGWISFNVADLVSCPAGLCNAQVDWSTGKVTGWARALSAIGSVGGWDGWIQLSDDSATSTWVGKGVKISGNKFSGFAWGSVITGWIDFAPVMGGTGGVTGVGVQISAQSCTAIDVPVGSWGSCSPLSSSQCTGIGSQTFINGGVQKGVCSTGGTTFRACNVTVACISAPKPSGTCGDRVCSGAETIISCPQDCKAKYQQF